MTRLPSKRDVRRLVQSVVNERAKEVAAADESTSSGVASSTAVSRSSKSSNSGWRRFDDGPDYRGRELVTETDAMAAHRSGRPLIVAPNALLTPLARDAVSRYRIPIVAGPDSPSGAPKLDGETNNRRRPCPPGTVVIGSDHGGFEAKEMLREFLEQEAKLACRDVGTYSEDACDYPDFAAAVAKTVVGNPGTRGIIVDGAGIGSCMVANKIDGVRAAHCSSVAEANNAREHNDATVLCLGGRMLDPKLLRAIALVFLTTDFGGGRHQRRIDKIMAQED